MGHHLYWTYAFNIFVNSTLSFFTTIILIELFMLFFRIKNSRMKVVSRALPFFKICLDLCLYHYSSWALLHGVNPLLAETGTRQLSALLNPFTGIQFSMLDGKTFSVADVIALSIDPLWIQAIVSVALIGVVVSIDLYLFHIFREKQHVSRIVQNSSPILFQNLNASLTTWMKKRQITLAVSAMITSPCIVGKTILFPSSLTTTLSQEEIEAIIAHELGHSRWKDCGLRLACSFIASLFWWIPSKWWLKRIEDQQEQASDAMIYRFGISPLTLAEAVLKTAKQTKETPSMLVFPFVGRRLRLKKRMQRIMSEPTKLHPKLRVVQFGLLICSLLSVLFGKLWIF